MIEIDPDLLLLGGDLTRDGNFHRYELEAIKDDLDGLPFPYHTIPGNVETGNKHTDVSGRVGKGQEDDISLNIRSEYLQQFSSLFGPLWWSFVHKGVRFSGFCDTMVGSGLPEEEELWKWMEAQKEQPKAKHHIWIMHHSLFIDDLHEPSFHITDPEQYLGWYFGIDEPWRGRIMEVFKAIGADIVINGHIQCRRTHYAEGIRFDSAPSTAFSQWADHWEDADATLGFLRYDITEQGIEYTFVPLEKVSQAKGYGPSGHPSHELRDYSEAWEK